MATFSKARRDARHAETMRHIRDLYDKAKVVLDQRGENYNRLNTIPDYWIFGLKSVGSLVYLKALRLCNNIDAIEAGEDKWDDLLDSVWDLFNYTAFAYAEAQMESEHRHRSMSASSR